MKSFAKIFVFALAIACEVVTLTASAQNPAAPAARQMSAEETHQANGVAAAPSATQKVQLLKDFLAAFPDTPVRGRLLTNVGIAISRESDLAVRVDLAGKFRGMMSTDSERTVAGEILADAYLKAHRVDDAFQTVAVLPSAEAVDVRLLASLVLAGADESRQRNLKHLIVSQKYGALAIRAMEADLIPAAMSASRWSDYKGKTLPSVHQALGLLALHAGTPADGIEHFRKAVALAPDDPQNYVFLGAAINEGYLTAAQQLKQLQPGATRDALARKVLDQLNQIVDAYARALALSTGSPEEETVRTQIWPDLESYYKFFHKGSLDGLQELIAKYKKQ